MKKILAIALLLSAAPVRAALPDTITDPAVRDAIEYLDSKIGSALNNISSLYGSIGSTFTVLGVTNGGTGATTVAGALANLGAPSVTGAGASGTWGISITGSANTAASAAIASALSGPITTCSAGNATIGINTSGNSQGCFKPALYTELQSTSTALSAEIARAILRENQIAVSTGVLAATLSTAVYTSGNQTIGDVKTFTSTIQGSVSGSAGTLSPGRTLNGVQFDGSANILVPTRFIDDTVGSNQDAYIGYAIASGNTNAYTYINSPKLKYNSWTGTVSATRFVGDFIGNASSSTYAVNAGTAAFVLIASSASYAAKASSATFATAAAALAATGTSCAIGQGARGIDVNGNATGCFIAGVDNLGNHIATTTLQMSAFPIVNVSSVQVITAAGYSGTMLSVSTGTSTMIEAKGTGEVVARRFTAILGPSEIYNTNGDITITPDGDNLAVVKNMTVASGKKVGLDGPGGTSYVVYSGGNVSVYIGGVEAMRISP